jgi:hypothetical protein
MRRIKWEVHKEKEEEALYTQSGKQGRRTRRGLFDCRSRMFERGFVNVLLVTDC